MRDIVHTSIGGRSLRISLSNVFGDAPVTFDSVYVGRQRSGARVVWGSNRRATFSGSESITVPPGAEVLSDPVAGRVLPDTSLAVSVHLDGPAGALTGHNLAVQTSYAADGDHAAEESPAAYGEEVDHYWYWVDALVVDAPASVDTVALLGDSITDGFGSTVGADRRWPDHLADRLARRPEARQLGVMNQGIAGNRVLRDSAGVSALARLDRDVLSQPDVSTVVLLEGINDIGNGDVTAAEQLIAGYRQVIARSHAAGVCVVGGTLTPFQGTAPPYYSAEKDAIRVAVNRWIRRSGEFDAVVDFDAATRDPSRPQRFLPAYDSGDHLHPGDAGYAAMAAAVDLRDLGCARWPLTKPLRQCPDTVRNMRAGLTPERVTEVGADLADEIGFDAVTISEVARRTGVKVASLYAHVAGSEDLRTRIALLGLVEMADRAAAALAGRSGRDALVALGGVYRDYAREHPGRYAAARLPLEPETAAASAGPRHARLTRAVLHGYGLAEPDETHAVRLLGSVFHGFTSLELAGGFAHSEPSSEESWLRVLDGIDELLSTWRTS